MEKFGSRILDGKSRIQDPGQTSRIRNTDYRSEHLLNFRKNPFSNLTHLVSENKQEVKEFWTRIVLVFSC
jgi:hypothetical protein